MQGKIMAALVQILRGGAASALWLVGVTFVSLRIVLAARDRDAARRVIAAHCRRFLDRCRITVEISGPPPPVGSGAVLCHNESAFPDVAAFLTVIWPHVDRAAGADLYAVFPFLRQASRKAGLELVPRGDRVRTDRLMDRVVQAVRAGERLSWGGEGRLSGQDGVARFKIGAALIAIRAQAPIIPLMIHGGHGTMPLGSIRARPGTIHLRFGAPIPTAGLLEADARDLADHVQAVVAGMYADFARGRP
jgi:1-acyl-sn-glycerol-3-phosphate acyltransferase